MALFEMTFPPYVPFGSRNLSLQSPQLRGTDVAIFQAVYDLMLKSMNPPQGPMGPPVTIDGIFGQTSRSAAINIQSYFGLSVDGIVGPNTFFVFGQGVRSHQTYGGPDYGSRNLSQGMSGGDVTILQNRLNTFRYARIIGKAATGFFDAATANAVKAFQQDAAANGDTGVPVDGVVGSATFDATWLYTFAGGRGIMSGRNGFDVVFVQTLLHQLGFYAGPIHGYYDAATQAAVRAFQTSEGLTADGVVGQQTFYHLGLHNDVAAPGPLGIAWPPGPPPPSVSVCSVGLLSQTSDLHPYGEASLVINQSEGFESLDVVGNLLPQPSSFGSQYGQYAFTLTNPSTGMIWGAQLMTELPGSSDSTADWGGSISPGVSSIPKGPVNVYPTPAGSPTGPYGPLVLSGNLQSCS